MHHQGNCNIIRALCCSVLGIHKEHQCPQCWEFSAVSTATRSEHASRTRSRVETVPVAHWRMLRQFCSAATCTVAKQMSRFHPTQGCLHFCNGMKRRIHPNIPTFKNVSRMAHGAITGPLKANKRYVMAPWTIRDVFLKVGMLA